MRKLASVAGALLCALLALPAARGLELHRSVPVACAGRFDIGSSAMYNLAFKWTKQSKLAEWTYTELGGGCALVGYRTQIRLHRIFESLMPSRVLGLKIQKNVCVRGDTLQETVDLSDVVLVDRMQISVRAELDRATDSLLMHAHSDLEVPWFLKVLESTIVGQVEDSLREYQDLLAQAVCVPS